MTERKYFGTDGIRGVASVPPLDVSTLVRIGKSIAAYFLQDERKHKILVGKDTRLSGYMIETALCAGITSMGVDVWLVGPLPTPGVSYLTRSMRADAGIMISASHNPFADNGIKIFGADGFKLPDSVELEIEQLCDSEGLDEMGANPQDIGKAHRIEDAVGRYTVFLKSCFPRELTLEGLRVGFDCANGAAYVVAPQTCTELGAEVVSRGISPNGRNINAGFGSLYPEVVKELVSEHNLDLGIALDGDADRAVFVDEKGNFVDGDMVLGVCAIDLKHRGLLPSNKVVATVMSNLGLEKMLERHGIELVRTGVGDRYVLEEMLAIGCILGGEQSGHTIFADCSTTGDGCLTALKIMEVMKRRDQSLSDLTKEFERYPQRLINIQVSKKPELSTIEPVQKVIESVQGKLGSRGRVFVRYSGTENKARVMVEYDDESLCSQYAEEIASTIEREIGAV